MKKYSKSHEWYDTETKRIGISHFAADEVGELIYIEAEGKEGQTFSVGNGICELESVKAVAEFYAPLNLKVIKVNSAVIDDPTLVNTSPEGDGWLFEVEVLDPEQIDLLE